VKPVLPREYLLASLDGDERRGLELHLFDYATQDVGERPGHTERAMRLPRKASATGWSGGTVTSPEAPARAAKRSDSGIG
jgi:hypothetical protein